jgi:hypothetical protein
MRYHRTGKGRIQYSPKEEAAKDIEEQAWTDGAVSRNASTEIQRLESAISSRRYREAIAGTDGGWLANQEKLIAVERGKL